MKRSPDVILAELRSLLEEARTLQEGPTDDFEALDVVTFTRTFVQDDRSRPYQFVAIKAPSGKWYTTGRGGPNASSFIPPVQVPRIMSWEELVAAADDGTIWFVSEWTQL